MRRFLLALLFLAILLPFVLGAPPSAAPVYAQGCPVTPIATGTPQTTYTEKVLNTQAAHLLAYWKLDETSGTTAADTSGNSRTGAYSGVTLNGTTFLDGGPAPAFDGINDYVNVYTASLSSAFNGHTGTLLIWAKVASSGVWTDSTQRWIADIAANKSSYFVILKKTSTNNTLTGQFRAPNDEARSSTETTTDWFLETITWDDGADIVKYYHNGSQVGANMTSADPWSGSSLLTTATVLGANSSAGDLTWYGYLAHAAVWDTVLSSTEISNLSTVPTIVPTITPYPTCTPTPTNTATDTPTPTATNTDTPGPTPTATNTATAEPSPTVSNTPTQTDTPDVHLFWTMAPGEGTPGPGRLVGFDWIASAGQVIQAVLLAGILFTLWVIALIVYFRRRRKK